MTSLQVALLWHRGLLAPRHLYYDTVGLPALAVGLGLGVRHGRAALLLGRAAEGSALEARGGAEAGRGGAVEGAEAGRGGEGGRGLGRGDA